MLRNTENLNSVALILSDRNIGLVATGSAIAHDLRLRERLLDLPMEEFPGRPMLGKRPADPQPDTKPTYPGGGETDDADTLCSAETASASPSEDAESEMCSTRIHRSFHGAVQQRRQHWRRSQVSSVSVRTGDLVVGPVCWPTVVSG